MENETTEREKKVINESRKTNAVEVRVHSRPLFHHTFRALLGTWDVEQVLGRRWDTLSRGTFIKLPTRKCAHAMSLVFHAITLQVYKLGMQCYIPTDWLATRTVGKVWVSKRQSKPGLFTFCNGLVRLLIINTRNIFFFKQGHQFILFLLSNVCSNAILRKKTNG